jgi:hypothetical protein
MAEQQLSTEEQKILALIHQLKTNSEGGANKKKVIQAIRNSRKFLDEALRLLEEPEGTDAKDNVTDAEAPYGRKLDGTPKKAPGRASIKATSDI